MGHTLQSVSTCIYSETSLSKAFEFLKFAKHVQLVLEAFLFSREPKKKKNLKFESAGKIIMSGQI
jgi:hypothetical protein